jgi:hypothetical protein
MPDAPSPSPSLDTPTPGTISAAELTAITGLTARHLLRLATQGHYPHPDNGRYVAGKTLIGFIKYQAELLRKKNGKLAKEQLALTKAKRQDKQLDFELRQELYVEKAVIGPALRNISLHQRAVLQRILEQEIAPNLSGLTPVEVVTRMKRAVDEICAVFRERTACWLDNPPPNELPNGEAGTTTGNESLDTATSGKPAG